MLRLYKQASGAQDVELVQEIPASSRSRTKRNLIRLLQESFDPEAVEALEKDPFELWEATNNFQDDSTFCI